MIIIANSIFHRSETTEKKLQKHIDFSCASLTSLYRFYYLWSIFSKRTQGKCRNPWLYEMDGCASK